MGLFDFMAGAPANSPTSYQGMEARRRIALQILANSRKGYPKTIGEGLTAVGDAIGDRAVLNQLAGQEGDYLKQAAAIGDAAIPPEARTSGPQSAAEAPTKTAYASEPAAAGYRPAPAYLQAALDQDVVDPERRAYLGQLAGKEAQSADEVSPTGAAGPFQFTRGTGAQYGLMPGGQDMRTDIHGSIAAAQNLTDDNAATLTKMLGRPPSSGELALAHQQGAVTAGRMLTGVGNAPARNLAVNNVNPGASPQAAAAKIMGYYGMPGSRDAMAATVAQRQAVPQPNPTLAGAPPPSAALPFSGSPTTPGGAGLPPEITAGASAIRPAPPQQPQIQMAPQQVAQATPPQTVPTQRAQPPQELPMHPVEIQGWQMMKRARVLGDPNLIAQAQSLIEYGANKNKQQYDLAVKDYQDRLLQQREQEKFYREGGTAKVQEAEAKASMEAEKAALSSRIGGGDPEKFLADFANDRGAAEQSVNVLRQSKLAKQALNDGIVSGAGADFRVNMEKLKAMFGNESAAQLAARSEQYLAAVKSTLNNAVQNIQGKDPKVTEGDVKIASGTIGADLSLQSETMHKLIDQTIQSQHQRLNKYEDLKDYYLGGTRREKMYDVRTDPTASQPYIDRLLKNKDDDEAKRQFDVRFGPGAAELEIARAKRQARRSPKGGD